MDNEYLLYISQWGWCAYLDWTSIPQLPQFTCQRCLNRYLNIHHGQSSISSSNGWELTLAVVRIYFLFICKYLSGEKNSLSELFQYPVDFFSFPFTENERQFSNSLKVGEDDDVVNQNDRNSPSWSIKYCFATGHSLLLVMLSKPRRLCINKAVSEKKNK